MPTLIIVSGPPCTGKSTLAADLAARLGLPYYSRDAVKEALFDTLGWSDRQRSRELGAASAVVLFRLLRDALAAGADCITESNFRPGRSSADFQRLAEHTGARFVQIQCAARGDVLVERFAARSATDGRHPGHCDNGNLEEFRAELSAGRYEPLDIVGPVLDIDTTDVTALDTGQLAEQLTVLLRPARLTEEDT